MTTRQQRLETEAIEKLLNVVGLKPGDTVYTKLNHASRSGMYRVINLIVIKDNEPWDISHMAAPLLEGYDEKHEGCKASGCGMDMGYHLVSNLSYRLFPAGFDCINTPEDKYRCPSNDHSNCNHFDPELNRWVRDEPPAHHSSGGYALKHRWM